MFLRQLNSKKNGPVLLRETILISLSCCLATNGKDGRVLKLEKAGPTCYMPAKITIKVILWFKLVLPDENFVWISSLKF